MGIRNAWQRGHRLLEMRGAVRAVKVLDVEYDFFLCCRANHRSHDQARVSYFTVAVARAQFATALCAPLAKEFYYVDPDLSSFYVRIGISPGFDPNVCVSREGAKPLDRRKLSETQTR
jgi:hypothetical protein